MSRFLVSTTRTVSWFKRAQDSAELEIRPPFQRNVVWTHAQKSYLIDSILNEFPIPELYMQDLVDENGRERHIVIDGQQRITACLEFIEGAWAIKEEESARWGGFRFEDLGEDKKRIYGYSFIVRLLPDMSDEDIRGIFQRLNKNVEALNAQELRQATYWGPFIKTMQEISNFSYWGTTGIFTPLNVRRMMDVEYITELAIAALHGHQNKKETLDHYYRLYEESFEPRDELVDTFRKVIFQLEVLFPDIKNTRWRKKTDFYSIFLYLCSKENYLPLTNSLIHKIRDELDDFSLKVTELLAKDNFQTRETNVHAIEYARSIRASSDVGNRRRRHMALSAILDPYIESGSASSVINIRPMQDGLFEEQGGSDI